MEKSAILAAIKALKVSFTTHHQNLRECLKDIDSRIAILTNTTSFPPLSFPPQPTTPTLDELLKKLETSLYVAAGSTPDVGRVAPMETEPSTEPLPGTKSMLVSDKLDSAVCSSLFPPVNSPPLILHRDNHHQPWVSESERFFLTSFPIAASRNRLEDIAYTPVSSFPTLAPSKCLKIVCTETVLRIFHGRAMISWTEEPPGSMFREFTTLKSLLVDRVTLDIHSTGRNCLFSFGEHILSDIFFFELKFERAIMDWCDLLFQRGPIRYLSSYLICGDKHPYSTAPIVKFFISVFYFCIGFPNCLHLICAFDDYAHLLSSGWFWGTNDPCDYVRTLVQYPGFVWLYEDEEIKMLHFMIFLNKDNSNQILGIFALAFLFAKMARCNMIGIGINLREISDDIVMVRLEVLGFILDGPAHSASNIQGDKLLSINGVDVIGKSAIEASSMLRGTSETSVSTMVKHENGGSAQSVKIQRQSISKSLVFYRLAQVKHGPISVGYVDQFTLARLLHSVLSGMAASEVKNPLPAQVMCGSLLERLQPIRDEAGVAEEERDKMFLQLEQEVLDMYKRKVDQAMKSRAEPLHTLGDVRVVLTNLLSALGEKTCAGIPEGTFETIKGQLALLALTLIKFWKQKDDKIMEFCDIQSQIQKISAAIARVFEQVESLAIDESNLPTEKLFEFRARIQDLEKENSECLHKVC